MFQKNMFFLTALILLTQKVRNSFTAKTFKLVVTKTLVNNQLNNIEYVDMKGTFYGDNQSKEVFNQEKVVDSSYDEVINITIHNLENYKV